MSCRRCEIANLHFSPGGSHGFTLLELMIALVLMSLILMLLFAGLDLGSRSWQKSSEKAERQSSERLTFDYLRRTLGGMRNERLTAGDKIEPLFSGERHSLRWVGPTASQAGMGGASLFRLGLLGDEEGKVLLLKRWLYHPEVLERAPAEGWDWRTHQDEDRIPADEQVSGVRYSAHRLLSGVTDIELDYYGSQQRGIPSAWHSEWKEPKKLPLLIRLRLHYTDRVTPPLVVAIPRGAA
ncbi:MAG: prepilin-type N-terminal cleavage/methylation domain-containing protein [Candidatus Thiodiazotropha sp. (ex Epidulcina cf. delphinae)]|nr:prepilin-type N-terminal cleavage/methylation domain-containing protein [Candidatus Thiodiazotropha sp. (ex Epidulcina cf. delphinae)]